MKLLPLLACLLCLLPNSQAQIEFKGKWKGVCLSEKSDSITYKICQLCTYNRKATNSAKPMEIELDFHLEDVSVKIGDYTSIKDFEYNSRTNSFEFYFSERLFKFKVMETEDSRVIALKDEEQNVILLYKK